MIADSTGTMRSCTAGWHVTVSGVWRRDGVTEQEQLLMGGRSATEVASDDLLDDPTPLLVK